MALTKVSGEVITRPLVLTGNLNISGIQTVGQTLVVGTGSSSTTINGAHEYPSIRPTLDLNFAATKTLDRRITFTRDSLGTYTDELGIVRTAPNNTPRFDHDPVTLESLGLLIEESRTNLCINSTSSSNWGTPFQLTKDASKTITAPSGDIDAYEWTETTDSTTHLNNGPSVSISSGSSYSISAFFKRTAGTLDRGYLLQWYKSGGGQSVRVSYVPSTDTTYISNSGGASAPTNVSVVTYPNGWYRISFTAALAETTAAAIIGVTDSSGLTSFTGDTSMKHSFWGLQYELGSFATSYIPTSGSTVTRAADIAKITGTNFSSWFNNTEGTIDISYKLGLDTTSNRIFQIGKSPTTNNFLDVVSAAGNGSGGYFYVNYEGTNQGSGPSVPNSLYTNTVFKVAAAYKENDVQAVNNKTTTVFTDTTVSIPSGLNQLYFCQYNGSDQLNGHLQTAKYYPKRLPLAQLQGLTAQ